MQCNGLTPQSPHCPGSPGNPGIPGSPGSPFGPKAYNPDRVSEVMTVTNFAHLVIMLMLLRIII